MRASRFLVGATGFEPATSSPPAKRATKLRHAPTIGSFYQRIGRVPNPLVL